jgi:hypothetical protein
MMSHRDRFEPFHISGQPPGQPAMMPNAALFIHRHDQ